MNSFYNDGFSEMDCHQTAILSIPGIDPFRLYQICEDGQRSIRMLKIKNGLSVFVEKDNAGLQLTVRTKEALIKLEDYCVANGLRFLPSCDTSSKKSIFKSIDEIKSHSNPLWKRILLSYVRIMRDLNEREEKSRSIYINQLNQLTEYTDEDILYRPDSSRSMIFPIVIESGFGDILTSKTAHRITSGVYNG